MDWLFKLSSGQSSSTGELSRLNPGWNSLYLGETKLSLRWCRGTKTLFLRRENGLEQVIRLRDIEVKLNEGEFSYEMSFFLNRKPAYRGSLVPALSERLLRGENKRKRVLAVKSPITGRVLKILKEVGDEVRPGEAIAVVEAMKMENTIKSDVSGELVKVHVTEGGTVQIDQAIVTLK